MSVSWQSPVPPTPVKITSGGWVRIALRAPVLVFVVFGGLLLLLGLRLIERPLCGLSRPVTPYITQTVCGTALWILGLQSTVQGETMQEPGIVVANHSSWLDIFVLNANKRIYFVSKSEVAGWPGIGWLARATGTLFVERSPNKARAQAEIFAWRLKAGHKLLFFPEGTSTDGQRVLRFKPTLFAALFDESLRNDLYVQPVAVAYQAPNGAEARFYGWWGDMDFGPHFLQILAAGAGGRVTLSYHTPLKVSAFADRKALAAACETIVRREHGEQLAIDDANGRENGADDA